MNDQRLEEADVESWVFDCPDFHLDAVQQAKKRVSDENDEINYRDLRGKVVNPKGYKESKYVVVVNARGR
jgi:hypothetical protein